MHSIECLAYSCSCFYNRSSIVTYNYNRLSDVHVCRTYECISISRPQLFIHADDSRGRRLSTSVILSVCLSVCTIKPKRLKVQSLNLPRDCPSWYLAHQLILGQRSKVKVTGSQSVKKILKAIEWPAWVMHFIECPASIDSNLSDIWKPFCYSTVDWSS